MKAALFVLALAGCASPQGGAVPAPDVPRLSCINLGAVPSSTWFVYLCTFLGDDSLPGRGPTTATQRSKVMKSNPPKTARPLADFMKAKRRAACKVCSLPPDILDQLLAARSAHIRRPDMLEWLKTEVGVEITDAELTAHYSGRHTND